MVESTKSPYKQIQAKQLESDFVEGLRGSILKRGHEHQQKPRDLDIDI